MVHTLYCGKIENGKGAQRNASATTRMNILFLFLDNGDMSSRGLTSILLMLNIKTNNATDRLR